MHLVKTSVGEKARIEYVVRPEHTGYPGILHGGVTCVLFDEVMYHAVSMVGVVAVLAKIAVEYKRPARNGDLLLAEAEIVERKGRKIEAAAILIERQKGDILAEARALFIEVDLEKL
ncbi:MAG: Thioesterase superfamily protein [Methanomassiliicoccales archaeon PtaU1.Bin124]|nr:MAG: Thioesterase superfamily protein [Methanomassiliicoccales archaeon PtaU1.Bin124]